MNSRHKKLYKHYEKVFHQKPIFSMKLKDSVAHDKEELSVTTLVFRPTKKTPFWKLCTIGASDYNMPVRDIGCGRYANRRNEYIMFISPDVKVKQSSSDWLKLMRYFG